MIVSRFDALADCEWAIEANPRVTTTKQLEVLYELGLIHDKVASKDDALNCFKQIYEVDYGYRDVAHRVESSYSS